MLFSSPFPISAAVEIFGVTENEILDLTIDLDELYGKVLDPNYWLYSFHPAVRNYVEDLTKEKKQSYHELKIKYKERFSEYYCSLFAIQYGSLDKENHVPALARFNIIFQGETNDFDRAAELMSGRDQRARILSYLGMVVSKLGLFSKALGYYERSSHICVELKDTIGIARNYANTGHILSDMGNNPEALELLKGALEIHARLNDRVRVAKDYTNAGAVLSDMGNKQEALDYHNRVLEIDKVTDDKVGTSNRLRQYWSST